MIYLFSGQFMSHFYAVPFEKAFSTAGSIYAKKSEARNPKFETNPKYKLLKFKTVFTCIEDIVLNI